LHEVIESNPEIKTTTTAIKKILIAEDIFSPPGISCYLHIIKDFPSPPQPVSKTKVETTVITALLLIFYFNMD